MIHKIVSLCSLGKNLIRGKKIGTVFLARLFPELFAYVIIILPNEIWSLLLLVVNVIKHVLITYTLTHANDINDKDSFAINQTVYLLVVLKCLFLDAIPDLKLKVF